MSIAPHIRLAALIPAAAALAACSGSGSLTVDLTDTPVDDATSVVINFTGIELHNTNGRTVTIDFPAARKIDLLQLQNGLTTALVQGESVPSGSYQDARKAPALMPEMDSATTRRLDAAAGV